MKNLLNVFAQPKKEKSKNRFEEAFEKKLEKELHNAGGSKAFYTEADCYDAPIKGSFKMPRSPANEPVRT